MSSQVTYREMTYSNQYTPVSDPGCTYLPINQPINRPCMQDSHTQYLLICCRVCWCALCLMGGSPT